MIKLISNFLIIISIVILVFIFWPVTKEEFIYQTKEIQLRYRISEKGEDLLPPNKDFSIVIPSIYATAPIIKNVDPFNKNEFLPALRTGIAHAKGTALPNQMNGNVYLFAHSTDSIVNVGRYNAIFYLIGKLEKEDEIKIYYDDIEYIYRVTDKKVVSATDTFYLTQKTDDKILTLQTCYPPGTTLKRLIVIAKLDR